MLVEDVHEVVGRLLPLEGDGDEQLVQRVVDLAVHVGVGDRLLDDPVDEPALPRRHDRLGPARAR